MCGTAHEKFKVSCPLHGLFETTPNYHQQGSGCRLCSIERRSKARSKSFEYYIEKAMLIHNNKYIYLTKANRFHSKIKIVCPDHGEFSQKLGEHANGRGCSKCSHKIVTDNNKKSYTEHILDFNKIHYSFYNYPYFEEVSKNKIEIICPIHGSFYQTINNHKRGQICPSCSLNQKESSGWSYKDWELASKMSSSFDSFKIYFIEFYNENESFIKIGRTFRTIKERFSGYAYNYKILKIEELSSAKECCIAEKQLHKKYKTYSYIPLLPFQGYTECFNIEIKEQI